MVTTREIIDKAIANIQYIKFALLFFIYLQNVGHSIQNVLLEFWLLGVVHDFTNHNWYVYQHAGNYQSG
jgi:hypothetical protein